jgi:hypothetical protein
MTRAGLFLFLCLRNKLIPTTKDPASREKKKEMGEGGVCVCVQEQARSSREKQMRGRTPQPGVREENEKDRN